VSHAAWSRCRARGCAVPTRLNRSRSRVWERLAWLQGTLYKQVNSALHPSGVAKSSTSFGWGKGGNVNSAGWQVTLCDTMWHVSSRSGVQLCELLYTCYLHTYLLVFDGDSNPHRKGQFCGGFQSNSSMHHYECVTLCKDISLQRGRFCTRSLASCIPRSSEDRSS